MRFCVNGRQPYSVIKQADEIKFSYNDKDRILDLVENYSDKVIILDVPGQESDWKLWQMYSEKFSEFHIALHDLHRAGEFVNEHINWFWPYPITSYYELDMIMDLHPSYIMLGPPLSFDLDRVEEHLFDPQYEAKTKRIPTRMIVNVAHPAFLPINGSHGICGQWVRPEDVDLYSTYIQCFEFDEVDLKQEATLLHIYKDNKEWPGNLNLLIQKLRFNVDNRAIPEEFGERRLTCKQRCWEAGSCTACVRSFYFAEQLRKEKIRRKKEKEIDNN